MTTYIVYLDITVSNLKISLLVKAIRAESSSRSQKRNFPLLPPPLPACEMQPSKDNMGLSFSFWPPQ